ncbi:MSCRAMM family protein [Novosphingobium ovatum]|uniref:MSCRAMM family protein n=1 Tax=Novosphingobium ovatum TaxID=1908523 RepID=UPI001D104794|nr:hypothetical protein [Novosphingobium ovatum]
MGGLLALLAPGLALAAGTPPEQVNSRSAPPPPPAGGKPAPTGHATALPGVKLSSRDELILEIQTVNREMSDTLTGYGLRSGLYLPFSDMVRFLDLSITVSDDGHYASGWFLRQNRTLQINLRQGVMVIMGKEIALKPGDATAFNGEMYLKAEKFEELFPMTLKIDMRSALITVTTKELFPFQEKLAREAARERLSGQSKGSGPVFPRQTTPYRGLTFPIFDVEWRAQTDGESGPRTDFDLHASGDLAFMTARTYVATSTQGGLTGASVQIGRRDPTARLLGPLHATEFQAGDIGTASLPLGLRGISGRGAYVTNTPLEQASVFDKIDFRGELPKDYEVELYRNDQLVGSTREQVNGQYEFLQVPVDFGINVFRLVFYGPLGQRREEVRRISVGDGRIQPGKLIYYFGSVEREMSVAGIRNAKATLSADYGAYRHEAILQYGLARWLTVVASGAMYRSEGADRWLTTAGLRTGIGNLAIKLDAGMDNTGGTAGVIGLGGRLLGVSYVGSHAIYQGGFIDEMRSSGSQRLSSVTQLDLNRTFKIAGHNLPTMLSLQRLRFTSGQEQIAATLRQSTMIERFMVSNTLNMAASASPGLGSSMQMNGAMDISTLTGRTTQYRATVQYSVVPTPKLNAIGLEMDRPIADNFTVKAAASHVLASGQSSVGLSGSRRFGPLSLSVESSYAFPRQAYTVGLRLGFSFGRNPLSQRMFVERPGLSNSGAVAVSAFRDENGNQTQDEGEQQIGKVTFFTGTQQVTSTDKGEALMGGIGDGNRTAVKIDATTLPDISMAPSSVGYEILPRAGRIHITRFAIQHLSEIEGKAMFSDGTRRRGVSGVTLFLMDMSGKRVAKVRTEGDGFFLFELLKPGEYRIEISPDQARNLKIRMAGEYRVVVGAKRAPAPVQLEIRPQ